MALQSIAPASLFTVSRPDGIAYFDSNGVLQQSAADELVIDHKYNPATGRWEPRGAPVFPGGTNNLPHSQDLSGAGYDRGSVTTTTAGITPLRAGSVATLVTRSTDGNALVRVTNGNSYATTNGQRTTLVAVIEADPDNIPDTTTNLANFGSSGAGGAITVIDWSDLSLSYMQDSYANGTAYAHDVIDLGTGPNGGQMVLAYITAEHTSGGSLRPAIYPRAGNEAAGIGMGVIVHHFQHNDGDNVFPLIFSEGTATARSEDRLSISQTASGWLTVDQFTMSMEWETLVDDPKHYAMYLVWDSLNRAGIYQNSGTLQGWAQAGGGATVVRGAVPSQNVDPGVNRAALSVDGLGKQTAFAADGANAVGVGSDEGGAPLNGYGGTVPNLGQWSLNIGSSGSGASIGGWLRSARFLPRYKTANELEALVA